MLRRKLGDGSNKVEGVWGSVSDVSKTNEVK